MEDKNNSHGFLDNAINTCLGQMDPQKAHTLVQMMFLMFPIPVTIDKEPVRRKPFQKYSRLITVPLREDNQTHERYNNPVDYQ